MDFSDRDFNPERILLFFCSPRELNGCKDTELSITDRLNITKARYLTSSPTMDTSTGEPTTEDATEQKKEEEEEEDVE